LGVGWGFKRAYRDYRSLNEDELVKRVIFVMPDLIRHPEHAGVTVFWFAPQ
jgi:hypothetical protein